MGKQQETVTDFIFLGSKITVNSDCSHEIKISLLHGRATMANLNSIIKKQRHHFGYKYPSSQSYGFSSSHVGMWELDPKEGWALKNWCLLTVVLSMTFESPSDSKDIKPVNPKGNNLEYSFEGLMLRLKFQYFGHLIWRADLLKTTLMLGEIECRRRRRQQRMRWLDDISDLMDMSLGKVLGMLKDREAWHAAVHWVTKNQTWLNNLS